MGRSSNAHNFLIFRTERFEIFTICRRPPVLQTDARVGMMKIVVRETEARKASGRRTSTPRYLGIETLLRAGAHGNTCASVGPIRVQNLKAIRALESAYNSYPHLPWALWENRKYHNCGPGRARTMIIFTPE